MILVDNGSTQRPANVSGSNLPVPIACHLGAKLTRGGGTTADMILSQATNGNTEYEIYDIGNNAISAGYLLGKIGARLAVCRPRRLHRWRELPSSGPNVGFPRLRTCGRIRLCARTANRDH